MFVARDCWTWFGWSLQCDYHNVIGTVTVLTLEIGFEYVRRECDMGIKKHSHGWSLFRNG